MRSVRRNLRRNIVTGSTIALGIAVAILIVGVRDDTYQRLVNTAAEYGSGHIAIATGGRPLAPEVISQLSGIPGIRALSPRIQADGVLAQADRSRNVRLLGIDTMSDPAIDRYRGQVTRGQLPRPLTPGGSPGLVLGQRLADLLHTDVGRRVVLTVSKRSVTEDGTPSDEGIAADLFVVDGIAATGSDELDTYLALANVGSLAQLLGGSEDSVDLTYSLMLHDYRASDSIRRHLEGTVDKHYKLTTWKDNHPELRTYLTLDKLTHRIILLIVGLVIAMGIYATVNMNITERQIEIGVMRSLGLESRDVYIMLLVEMMVVAALGTLGGLALAIPPYAWLHRVGLDLSRWLGQSIDAGGVALDLVLRCSIDGDHLVVILLSSFVLTLIASLRPAWRAGTIEVIQLLRPGNG